MESGSLLMVKSYINSWKDCISLNIPHWNSLCAICLGFIVDLVFEID